MEKYREFIYYWKVESYKSSKMKATYALIILFGLTSIAASIVETERMVAVVLINIINISLAIKLKRLYNNGNKDNLHLFTALRHVLVSICLLSAYYYIVTDYRQVSLFRDLICVNGIQMFVPNNLNRINSIAHDSIYYKPAEDWAKKYLKGIGLIK